jgi:copper chaperone CopZ
MGKYPLTIINKQISMKTLRFILATLTFITLSVVTSYAQHDHSRMGSSSHDKSNMEQPMVKSPVGELKVEIFKVSGVCKMCESTIEKAAKVEGVSKAEWNTETKYLTLAYDPNIVTSDKVLKLIADSGYDNEIHQAREKAYNALPGCCKYERMEMDKEK